MAKLLGMTGLMTATVLDAASTQDRPAARAPSPRPQPPSLRIDRTDLARAMRSFSRQTGRQVGFSPSLVRGKTANAVSGRLDPDTALARLLFGTGLSFRAIRGGYVLISAAPLRGAASSGPPKPDTVDADIVVIGTRMSDGDAKDVKRRALQSLDVLSDTDIAKLPDTSLADVVRRILGVQLSVRAGGGIVTVRGLSQTEDRINGRNLSNTVVRGFDIAALPSDIVSGIDIYKTPSASQIEGGIGGVIDFHTRRPLASDRVEANATLKGVVGDLDGQIRPYLSGRVGSRIATDVGEIGLLIGGSRQSQDVSQDLVRIDGYTFLPQGTSMPSGTDVAAPVNATKRYLRGTKRLTTGYGSAQWQPSSTLEIVADLLYNRSDLSFTNMSLLAALAQAAAPSRLDLIGDVVGSGRWSNVPIASSTSRGTGAFRTFHGGLNGIYRNGAWTLSSDLSRTTTSFDYSAPTLTLAGSAPGVTYTGGRLPRFVIDGADPSNTETWRFDSLGDFVLDDNNAETALRLDGTYELGGVVKTIKLGARWAKRSLDHRLGVRTVGAPAGIGSVDASDVTIITGGRLFDKDYPQARWISASGAALTADRVGVVRTAFGVGEPEADPALSYRADETASSAYVEGTFGAVIGGHPVDGNAGVRYAGTDLRIAGPSSALAERRRYNHWLPSLNVRVELDRRLYLRFAFSRQISRPAFTLLAPTISLDAVNGVGDAGNPALKPLIATQFDTALEFYPVTGGSVHAAAFYKRVTGFVRMQSSPESVEGRPFLISRPFNVDNGYIGGLESGFTQRFTRLPGVLGGLGLQASYTFIDSFDADNGAGFRVPLEQMSRHNYALAATYDKTAISAAVTWIWRSRIVQTSAGDTSGRPLFRDPYGQLDATAMWALTPRISLSASAINLLQRQTTEYFGSTRYLNQTFIESRRFLIGAIIRSKPK